MGDPWTVGGLIDPDRLLALGVEGPFRRASDGAADGRWVAHPEGLVRDLDVDTYEQELVAESASGFEARDMCDRIREHGGRRVRWAFALRGHPGRLRPWGLVTASWDVRVIDVDEPAVESVRAIAWHGGDERARPIVALADEPWTIAATTAVGRGGWHVVGDERWSQRIVRWRSRYVGYALFAGDGLGVSVHLTAGSRDEAERLVTDLVSRLVPSWGRDG